MYAVKAVPLGWAAAVLPLFWPGPACAVVLFAAAAAQLGDAGIGVSRREWGVTAGSTVLAVVHAVTAIAVW